MSEWGGGAAVKLSCLVKKERYTGVQYGEALRDTVRRGVNWGHVAACVMFCKTRAGGDSFGYMS